MNNIAKISKRFSAYLLDIILIYVLISLIISIRFINPHYEKYVTAYEKYNKVINKYYDGKIDATEMVNLNKDNLYYVTKYSVSSNIVVIVVLIGYFVLFQKYNNGQTLGKKIMRIKVTSIDKEIVSIGRYFLRILPMYYIFIGNIIAVLLNTIAVYLLKSNEYLYVNSIITYLFLSIGIITLVMTNINKDKQGLHDKIAKTIVVDD